MASQPDYKQISVNDSDYSNIETRNLAYSLFPDAVYIDPNLSLEDKITLTNELILNKKNIIGGWFCFKNLYIFIDILIYQDGWNAYAIQKTHLRNIFQIEDFTLHFIIAEKNQVEISNYNLIYINKKYIRKENLEIKKLFHFKSIYDMILEKKDEVNKVITKFGKSVSKSSVSKINIGEYCFKPVVCEFKETCWSHIHDNSVFEIASLSRETKFSLYRKGIIKQEDISDFDEFTDAQILQINSLKNKKEIIDKKNIRIFLSEINYPVFYMDFESFMPAIPLFKNTRPFQHIPVQYSLIKKNSPEAKEIFYDFLAQPPEYPLKEFIKNLLKDLGKKGSIFVYDHRLETRQLREIGHIYPNLVPEIESVINRFVDLLIPFQNKYYYSPGMKGLSSLKNTLPAIYPDFSYRNLVIQNGYMAITALESLYYEKDKKRIETTRKNLIEYCQLDTLAMVKIHEFFNRLLSE